MNQRELIEAVASRTKGAAKATKAVVDAALEAIKDALARGEELRLSIGVFKVANRPARKGRNLRTGETVTVPAGKTVKFKAASGIKQALKDGKAPAAKPRAKKAPAKKPAAAKAKK